MRIRSALRLALLVVIGSMLGCGGGGGNGDGCPDLGVGTFDATVDFDFGSCGPAVHGAWTADWDIVGTDRILITLYVPGAEGCCPSALLVYATRTSATTYDMDNQYDAYLCFLDAVYDYQLFDLTSGTITLAGDNFQLTASVSAEHDTGTCAGSLSILAVPNP